MIQTYTREQYYYVRDSRQVLFNYCRTISENDFLNQNTSFGRGGSIRNLLVHIVNTYEFWIAKHALKKHIVFSEYESKKTINDVVIIFLSIDSLMNEFTEAYDNPEIDIEFEINGEKNIVKPLKLFTHVITHEFHHKGQILSLSRHMDYTPVDTDIMR
jgi:uncharacterized damage-inducible protein DinB